MDERVLVERARAGDRNAFRCLVEQHRDRAYGVALRIVRSASDAEEVAQDGFVRAWLALPRFRGESSFSTWLHRIVVRQALDRAAMLRRRRGRETDVEEAGSLSDLGPATGDLDTHVRARVMERLVGALPAAQRAAVTLYYYEGRSVEQVAQVLAMPENTIKTHLSRARAALRSGWIEKGEAP